MLDFQYLLRNNVLLALSVFETDKMYSKLYLDYTQKVAKYLNFTYFKDL